MEITKMDNQLVLMKEAAHLHGLGGRKKRG